MKIFFLRFSVVLGIIFTQLSFLDILFPRTFAPIFLFSALVAWTLIVSFPAVLRIALPLVLLFEALSSGTVGSVSLYSIPLLYATSFLSRRLLIEHRGMGIFLYALYVSAGVFGYQLIFFSLKYGSAIVGSRELFSSGSVVTSFVLSFFCFVGAYAFLSPFEARIKQISKKEFLNVK